MFDDFVPFCKADIEASIPEVFERQVRAGPDRVAVGNGHRSLTYDQLNRWSNRIAQSILRMFGDAEEPVALLFRQSTEAVVATLGTLKAGKIYVPLEPLQSEQALQQVIADCKPRLILSDGAHEALATSLIGANVQCSTIETMILGEADDNPGLQFVPERVSYIFYTSGTTGPPKGVFDNHRNVLHNIMRYTNTLGIGPSDRLALIESCSYSGTVSSLFSALLNGAAICPFDLASQGMERMAHWIDDQAITIFHSVPTIFEQLLARRHRFDDLRMIRLEGDRAEPRHITLFQNHFAKNVVLVNGLGTTETGIVRQFFVTPDDRVDGPVVPIGQSVDDMGIALIDDSGQEVEPGHVGEIVVQSAYLACGYWERSDLTDARFSPDPTGGGRRCYRTGDLGRMRMDGLLEYLGRKDFQAKVRGQWIDTAEIERALYEIAGIDRALVVTRKDRVGTQRLVAYLVAEDVSPTADTMREAMGRSLPAIMVPSRFVFMDGFPEDRNGKINRGALPEPEQARPPLAQDFVAPRNSAEESVAECVCQVLCLDRVGIHDDFLDLGGDSLLATELLIALEVRLGVTCSPALIDRNFSVVSIIDRLHQSLPDRALVLMQAGDGRAPLFCIHNYGGSILEYYRLLHCLGPDQAVYGLQSRAYTEDGTLDASVEEMAAAYVQELTSLRSTGPYHLCGNCFGGVVAFEMARQLRQKGHEVGLLAIIDTEFPSGFLNELVIKVTDPWYWSQFSQSPIHQKAWLLIDGCFRFARRSILEGRRSLMGAISKVQGKRSGRAAPIHERVLEQTQLAMVNYKPQSYGGAMALICIGPPHDQRGWVRMAEQGCQIIEVPYETQCDATPPHLTSQPYVVSLAEQIKKLLAEFK